VWSCQLTARGRQTLPFTCWPAPELVVAPLASYIRSGSEAAHYEPVRSGEIDAAVLGLVLTPYRAQEAPSHRQQMSRDNKARLLNLRASL